MPKLPVVSGIKVVKALSKIGYEIERRRGRNLDVKVAVDKLGNAIIKDLFIDG